jgi:hypothetical protein
MRGIPPVFVVSKRHLPFSDDGLLVSGLSLGHGVEKSNKKSGVLDNVHRRLFASRPGISPRERSRAHSAPGFWQLFLTLSFGTERT